MELSKQFLEKFNQWSENCMDSGIFERPLLFKSGGTLIILDKKGNKIHIKKANRGKFTDYCGGKVTSECIARGKRSPDPKIRKRATFAANVRKWKHEDGGTINGVKFINKTHNTSSITDTNQDMANYSLKLLKRKKKK